MQSSRSKRLSSLLVFLAAVMLLALTGCTEGEGPEAPSEPQGLTAGELALHGHGGQDGGCITAQSGAGCSLTWDILQQLPDGYPLTDVGGSSSTDVYVVGWQMPHRFYLPGNSHGRVINYDGFQWVDETGPDATLHAVDVSPTGKLAYIVGTGGTVAKKLSGSSSWQVVPTSITADLSDVFIDPKAQGGYAVGRGGTLLRLTGAHVAQIPTGTSSDLNAIWGNGGTFIVVGDDGTVIKGLPNGNKLTPLTSGTGEDLNGIWGNGGTFIVAGDNGTLLEFDKNGRRATTAIPSGTSENLNGIWGNGGTFVVAGDNGTLLVKTNKTDWTRVQLQFGGQAFTEDLTAVWGTSASDIFVTSDSGTVLHFGLH